MLAALGGAPAPDAQFVLQLLLTAVLIGNVVAVWIGIVNRRSLQKREITFSFDPASKEEFTAHCERNQKEHDQLFAKVGGIERGFNQKVDEMDSDWHKNIEAKFATMIQMDQSHRENIHKRINALEAIAAGTKAAVDLQTAQIARMDTKLDNIRARA